MRVFLLQQIFGWKMLCVCVNIQKKKVWHPTQNKHCLYDYNVLNWIQENEAINDTHAQKMQIN